MRKGAVVRIRQNIASSRDNPRWHTESGRPRLINELASDGLTPPEIVAPIGGKDRVVFDSPDQMVPVSPPLRRRRYPECIGEDAPALRAQRAHRLRTCRPSLSLLDSNVLRVSPRRLHRVSHSAPCTSAKPTLAIDSVVDPHENCAARAIRRKPIPEHAFRQGRRALEDQGRGL